MQKKGLQGVSSMQRPVGSAQAAATSATAAYAAGAGASTAGAFASSTSAASLSALNKIPGWRGTLVLSPDGAVLQSAGELINNTEELGSKFAALAHRVGQFFALQPNKGDGFKRLSIMSSDHSYLMTCAGDAIYVVKRKLSPETADQDPPLIDLQEMDPAMRV